MAFEIPRRDYGPLALLLALDKLTLDRLSQAIEGSPPSLNSREFSERIAASSGMKQGDVAAIVRLLVSLFITRSHDHEPDTGDFFSDLRAALQATAQKRLDPSDQSWETLVSALTRILGSSTLAITAKAIDVLMEHQNVFTSGSARILTEYRPIFNDVSKPPVAGAILHSLKLAYFDGAERRELYLALDTKDLAELRRVLDRAEAKASSLSNLFGASGVPVFEFPGK